MLRDDFDQFPRVDTDDVERMLAHLRQNPAFLEEGVNFFRKGDFLALKEFDRLGKASDSVADLRWLEGSCQTKRIRVRFGILLGS